MTIANLRIGLFLAITCTACSVAPRSAPVTSKAEQLVLLGTGGGPIARISRSQPAAMLQLDGATYLIDVGAGAERQIVRAHARLNSIDAVFLTHLHFDHTAGLPAFLALDWQDRRQNPVNIIGPPGTAQLTNDALRFLASGEAIFSPELPDLRPLNSIFSGRDVDLTEPAVVYQDAHIIVRGVENSHYATMHLPVRSYGTDRSYSYRFESPRRTIVFTGDTGPSDAVVRMAHGADVLVCEVVDLPALLESLRKRGAASGANMGPLIEHMEREHLTPENVGRLAAAAGVRRLVLTHFAEPPAIETIDKKRILTGIRKSYAGPVVFGEDLDVF